VAQLAGRRHGRLRQEQLAPTRGGRQASGQVHGGTEPVAGALHGQAGVRARVHRRQVVGRAQLGAQPQSQLDGLGGVVAPHHHGVAQVLHDLGAVLIGQARRLGAEPGRQVGRRVVAPPLRERREPDEVRE
jgi:hypothetical protein